MNIFTSIPPRVRQYVYIVYGVATLIVSSVATYQGALGHTVPEWAIGAGAVLVPIGVAVGATAAANTLTQGQQTYQGAAWVDQRPVEQPVWCEDCGRSELPSVHAAALAKLSEQTQPANPVGNDGATS